MATGSADLILKAPQVSRFPPELLVRLQEIDMQRKEAAAQGSSVTIDDIGNDSFAPGEDAQNE